MLTIKQMHNVKDVTHGNKQNDVTMQLCRCTDIKVVQMFALRQFCSYLYSNND